ncbi:Sulfotransferase [Paracoccaceae bacterium]
MPIYRIGSTKVLFIHIPKTAGMALDAHLSAQGTAIFSERITTPAGMFGPRHQPASVLTQIFLPEMIDYAFTVVRHPVARLVSEYRYQRRGSGLHLSRFRFLGFDAWLNYSLGRIARNPLWRVGHFRPQSDYPCFDSEVFKYEDGLEAVMQGVSRATGVEVPFHTPERNVSTHRAVRISQASLDRIARAYAADFDRFGYTIQPPPLRGVTLTD